MLAYVGRIHYLKDLKASYPPLSPSLLDFSCASSAESISPFLWVSQRCRPHDPRGVSCLSLFYLEQLVSLYPHCRYYT